MTRRLLVRAVFLFSAAAVAGCSCGLEDAGEIATRAGEAEEGGKPAEAISGYLEAGECVRGDVGDDPQARYLLAAVFYHLHMLGAPKAFEPGDEGASWASADLAGSGKADFLALAFYHVLALENLTFVTEGIPAWATVDRYLIAGDEAFRRVEDLVGVVQAGTPERVPPEYAEALIRISVLEVARVFCVQAWRRALESGLSPEQARRRLAVVYRGMAAAWDALASVPGVGAEGKTEFNESRDRCIAWAERVAILINPDDLRHPVEREMLKLSAEEHMRDGRKLAMDGLQEKLSGNRSRALMYVLEGLAHFAQALIIGVPEGSDRRSLLGYLRDLLQAHRDLCR